MPDEKPPAGGFDFFRGDCSVSALHPRQPRPFGTAVRYASGVLREQCSLVEPKGVLITPSKLKRAPLRMPLFDLAERGKPTTTLSEGAARHSYSKYPQQYPYNII